MLQHGEQPRKLAQLIGRLTPADPPASNAAMLMVAVGEFYRIARLRILVLGESHYVDHATPDTRDHGNRGALACAGHCRVADREREGRATSRSLRQEGCIGMPIRHWWHRLVVCGEASPNACFRGPFEYGMRWPYCRSQMAANSPWSPRCRR